MDSYDRQTFLMFLAIGLICGSETTECNLEEPEEPGDTGDTGDTGGDTGDSGGSITPTPPREDEFPITPV